MLRFIVSLVLLFASIGLAVGIEGGKILSYVGVTSFIVELLIPSFAVLAVWHVREVGAAFRDAFRKKTDVASRTRSMQVWDFAEKMCYAAAVIGLLLGSILILGSIHQNVLELGRAFGATLLAPLYGILLAIICRIMKARVEQQA